MVHAVGVHSIGGPGEPLANDTAWATAVEFPEFEVWVTAEWAESDSAELCVVSVDDDIELGTEFVRLCGFDGYCWPMWSVGCRVFDVGSREL